MENHKQTDDDSELRKRTDCSSGTHIMGYVTVKPRKTLYQLRCDPQYMPIGQVDEDKFDNFKHGKPLISSGLIT